jgi:hypothetical protein
MLQTPEKLVYASVYTLVMVRVSCNIKIFHFDSGQISLRLKIQCGI